MATLEEAIEAIADLIVKSKRCVIFTGAGVSTESGIPDFRGPGGVWTKFDPKEHTFQRFISDEEYRKDSWKRFREGSSFTSAKPNAAHYAIAELESLGKLDCLITQNIDNLHQEAGNTTVIELHGTVVQVKCLDCGVRYPREHIRKHLVEKNIDIPECEKCGGMLKSATISFGEPMPEKETREASLRSQNSDLFIVVGSSLVVHPAAMMPIYAKQAGAHLVILNLSETPHDEYTDIIVRAKAGEIMPPIIDMVKEQLTQ